MKRIFCSNFLEDLKIKDFEQETTVTLGNFDGCHLAHQKLLTSVTNQETPSVAIAFNPHPRDYFNPSLKTKRIFTLEQKLNAFEEMGIDFAIIQKFDHAFSQITHDEFYQRGLKKKLMSTRITVGENFCFGKDRKGNTGWLKKQGKKDSIKIDIIKLQYSNNLAINSTQIRTLIERGKIEEANLLLGHPFALMGTIEKGDQIGRTIGFPTANFGSIEQIIPQTGVYSGFMEILDSKPKISTSILSLPEKKNIAVMNIGTRPSLKTKQKKLSIEAHIIENHHEFKDLYDKRCLFYFQAKLREEIKFSSLDELKIQIKKDIKKAQKLSLS